MTCALLIDFGSTYTKVRAVDLGGGGLIASGQGRSTVTTDINEGLDEALESLRARMGQLPSFRYRLATSSAAGGLRMVTVGLVRELTALAASQAALGAGAKLVGTYAYRLTREDIESIATLAPDILLLSGGTDGGNAEVILHNARALAASAIACPIVAAGNREAADDVGALLTAAGKLVVKADNVMPELNVLSVDSARTAIRELFLSRIIYAKGIDRASKRVDVLMPTPAAVLGAAKLLAEGVPGRAGLGDLLVVDPGGATTDVHSACVGAPADDGVIVQGVSEPFAKRTVEGDLGMRHNASTIAKSAGPDRLAAESAIDVGRLYELLASLGREVHRLPTSAEEQRLDRSLARAAIATAVRRHAGTRETVHTALGPIQVQRGKDLSRVEWIIGTGGPIAAAREPDALLAAALADPREPQSLRPRSARLGVDRHYVLFAAGLLAEAEPRAAFELCIASLEARARGRDLERSDDLHQV